jgi:hypothetical protein
MHITGSEVDLVPSAVAAVAIIAGWLGVKSTSHGQLKLARESYERDRLTETYLDMLKGVHLRNAQIDDTYSRQIGEPSRTPKASEFDPTTDDETLFAARLAAYASPKVDKLWGDFALRTTEFDNLMRELRSRGIRPAELQGAERQRIEGAFDQWRQLREDLKGQVRRELRKPAR